MADIRQIQVIPSQIERTAGNGGVTLRGTSANLSYNRNLLQKLQAIVNKDWTQDDSLFDDGQLPVVTIEELQKLLTQVVIRFDNDPNYYTKRDYYYLIWYLCESLIYITNIGQASIDQLTDLQTQINTLIPRLDGVDSQITSILNQLATIDVTSLDNRITQLEQQTQQGLLTAGSGIEIASNTINAVYTDPTFHTTVKVGGLDAGSEIKQGDKIIDILYQILSKIVDVVRIDPKVSFTLTPNEAEKGDTVQVAGVINLIDGYYDPAEEGTNMTRQYMGCVLEVPTTEQLGDFANVTSITDQRVALATTIDVLSDVKLDTTISAHSTNNGCKSDGEISEQNQTEFTFDLSKTVRAFRNVYLGSISLVDLSSEEALAAIQNVSKGDLTPIAKTFGDKQILISSMQTVAPSTAVVLACPSDYKLTSVIDGDSPFETVGQYVEYSTVLACGGTHTESYKLYVNPIQKTTVNLNIASIKFEKEA